MSQPLLIVSTCGISLFMNVAGPSRSILNDYSNCCRADDVPPEHRQVIEAIIEQARVKLANADAQDAARASAEINGLLAYLRKRGQPSHMHHLLIHTDTWIGSEAAELVRQWITTHRLGTVEPLYQKDLQTSTLDMFQNALAELTRSLNERIAGYREQHYRIVFNLTGGFKSINGYLQAVGMFYADEMFYLFENSDQPMIIPRLPVKLDAEATIREHLLPIRRMALGLLVRASEAIPFIPETFLLRMDGEDHVGLSAWGELLWQESRATIYETECFPPPTNRVRLGPKFAESVRRLSPDRLRHINERLDDLACCLEKDHNPPSLNLKPLKGKPKPGITHECNAWADEGARRLFGYYEGGDFVVDHLGDHL